MWTSQSSTIYSKARDIYAYSHPKDLIIGDTSQGIRTQSSLRNINNHLAFVL